MSFLTCDESRDRKAYYRSLSKNVRKNLQDELKEEEVPTIGHVQVFLRIKPVAHDSHFELSSTLQIKDEHTLVTLPPKESYTFKSLKHYADSTNAYKFSKIFGPSTSQKDVFNGVVAPFVEDFVNGTDCLLFAYGPSSAGKTFTMQGSPKHPGLIPRTLDVLFNTIKDHIMKEIRYKPMRHDNIIVLSNEAIEKEHKKKDFILNWNPKSVQESSRYIKSILPDNTTLSNDSTDKETSSLDYISSCSDISIRFLSESRVRDKDTVTLLEKQKDMKYSVWVSFAEVYNETVYDLLEYLPGKAPANIKRNKLKLVNDHNGNTFISDLREVCVTSEDEAYQVMLFGKCNLQFATTKLNHKSSRSHCIFTIKLVQVPNVSDPKFARINMLTFCDLAGSERVEKSGNIGERLKETGNINTSLLVLGRCLKALRSNQTADAKMMVPFRESKLTRIFQNSLTGSGNVAMIVNINQSPLLFDETINVLKYSAVAQEIVLKPPEIIKPPPKRKTRFSVFVDKHKKLDTTTSVEVSCEVEEMTTHEKDSYERVIERLRNEIENLKQDILTRELKVRKELCNRFSEMMQEQERKTSKLLRETEKDMEEYYLWEIERMEQDFEERLKKARMEVNGSDENLSKDQSDVIDGLNSKIEAMTREVDDLKNKLNRVQSENDELKITNSDFRCKIEALEYSSLSKHELFKDAEGKIDSEDGKATISAMNNQISKMDADLKEKSAKIKEFEELLEEASLEYLELENTVGKYQEEASQQKAAMAEMEMKISELISNSEVCDALLADCNAKLERKNDRIEKLENDIKEYEEERSRALGKKGDSETAIENELKSVIDHLNKENASLKENVSDLEIMILDLRNKIEDSTYLAEKYESLLNSESKCKIKNEQLMAESSKLKEEKEQLEHELLSLSDENKDLKEKIASCKLEEEIRAMSSDLGNMCIASSDVEKSEISLQCDMINELHEEKLSDLMKMLDESKASLLIEKDSKKMLEEEKNAEIMHLQKALKAFLQEKCQGTEEMKNLELERAKLEEKIKCLESEVKESNKALREVIKEKRQEDDQNKSKVFEGSEKLLEVLKEELEKKGEAIQRLLEDNQSIRDVVIEKERELQSFSENHEKQFKHYESLVSKLREDIEMHNREEMRLRSLLQIGTPNKYEKSYLNVSSELSQLKKQLSIELCRDCSVKVLPMEKKNSSLSDVRMTVSNENMAPIGRSRRRSKSQPSYSLVDYREYDDDSDFEIEKKPRRRNRRNPAERTFTGMEANMNDSERSDDPVEPKTPFSKSRKLLNPKDGSTFLDLKEQVPIMPRTPADVIKRMLRPRKH